MTECTEYSIIQINYEIILSPISKSYPSVSNRVQHPALKNFRFNIFVIKLNIYVSKLVVF